MTDKVAEMILNSMYGDATKQLLDLVMAAEKAFDDYGKMSIFGRDKGKEAKENFDKALGIAVAALHRRELIPNVKNPKDCFTALQTAMTRVRSAYPNWPRAYRYWDEFCVERPQQ